jgi:glucokinase
MTPWRLVADVGGTNVRFAQALDGEVVNVQASSTSAHRDFYSALDAYLSFTGDALSCTGAAIGAAGPVDHGVVKLTNGDWMIDAGAVSAQLGAKPVRVLNDLEAVACAVATFSGTDLTAIADREDLVGAPKLIVNVGTGFGAALAVPTATGWTPVACEPGHMKLALDLDAAQRVSGRCPSIEDVISGLARRKLGLGADAAFNDEFGRLLGQVCGDLVLATGSWGGVFLFGSVASAWVRQGEFDTYLAAFEDKGPMTDRMRSVPINHIHDALAALRGLAAAPVA